jgi:hypothetical protein
MYSHGMIKAADKKPESPGPFSQHSLWKGISWDPGAALFGFPEV